MPYSRPDINGWCFGDPQGCAILFIIPLAANRESFTAEDALPAARRWLLGNRIVSGTTALMGWINSRVLPDAPPGWMGVIGRGQDLSIMIRWKKQITAINALREIEQAEGGLPAWICSALLSAWSAVEKDVSPLLASSAVYYAAQACSQYPFTVRPRFCSRKDLELLVDSKPLPELLGPSIPELRSGTDYSRFVQLLGSRLLDEKWYRSRRLSLDFQEKHCDDYDRMMAFTACRLMLDPNPSIQLSGVPLHIRLQAGRMVDEKENIQQSSVNVITEAAISLYDYFIQLSPPEPVLRAFFPDGSVEVSQYRNVVNVFDKLVTKYNHPAAIHLANSLIDEADRNAAYAPQGLFRIVLPTETPLYYMGVKGLKLYFDKDQLWIQFLFPGPCPTLISWSAREFRNNVDEYPYAFSLTIAALQHDFRISPNYSFPEEKYSQIASPVFDPPPPAPSPCYTKGESIRMLPVAHRGHRIWGYQVERDAIYRRRTLVGAFRRHLPSDQHRREDALTLAAEFFLVLPDEHYTVVLPHARGGRSDKEVISSESPLVKSRGLAVAMAYENFLREMNEKDGGGK